MHLKSVCLLSVHHHECAQCMYGVKKTEQKERKREREKQQRHELKEEWKRLDEKQRGEERDRE